MAACAGIAAALGAVGWAAHTGSAAGDVALKLAVVMAVPAAVLGLVLRDEGDREVLRALRDRLRGR
jgi:hypothetical protein